MRINKRNRERQGNFININTDIKMQNKSTNIFQIKIQVERDFLK